MELQYDLGVLGGGQLARMTIQAAQRMGLRCLSIDPGKSTPASQVSPAIVGPLADPQALAAVFSQCARVTLENEFVPASSIAKAIQMSGRDEGALIPTLDALATIQDKLTQRQRLHEAGVPTPRAVALQDDGAAAVSKIGFPMVLKARFGGYDGKGTRYARTPDELEQHRVLWSGGGWMAEDFVPFKRELAVMVWVTAKGEVGCFPTMETVQVNHVCDLVFPSESDGSKVAMAAALAMGGVGLFGVELFEAEDGAISVNEIAPRPHNTGHYSLDWGGVSQFEQHVRVVFGLEPAPVDGTPTAMANLLGQERVGDWRRGLVAAIAGDPGVHVHWYGKSEARPGRKMGHLNVAGLDASDRAKAARERFYAAWAGVPA